jgi:ribosomal protein L11 methyltransferase
MDWVEVVVPAAAAEVDEIAALLADDVPEAAAGTEIRGDEVVFWAPLDRGEEVLAITRAAAARLAEAGSGIDLAGVRLQTAVPEAEWRDAWKRYFHVTRITPRIVVVPSWETYEAVAGDVVLDLDPGMAFGTGTHASTRLCLGELDRLATSGAAPDRFLDVGAGSGILAIAAAKLWPASRGLAIDNDPIAVAACVENIAHNKVDDRITSAVTPVEEVPGTFPLVLANIQAHVLLALREAICARLAPGGTLVLSGLLTPQAAGVAGDYAAGGLELVEVRPDSDDPQWSSAVLKRS